ncbi:MAG: hypothetical protein MHPSP_004020, partial [Paramarteilia canceri]
VRNDYNKELDVNISLKTSLNEQDIKSGYPTGINSDFVDHIRKKEQIKSVENMIMSSEKLNTQRLDSLQNKFIVFVKSLFESEKKSVLDKNLLKQKVVASFSSIDCKDFEVLFYKILDHYPGWLVVFECKGKKFVKYDKSLSVMD